MKRSTEADDDDDTVHDAKKSKVLDTADIVASLKQRLKEEQNEIAALKEFVKETEGEHGKEFIEIYLTTSPECKEIFALFDADGRVPPEKLTSIWEAFERILVTLSQLDEDNKFSSTGSFISNKILQNHIKLLYSSLSNHGSTQLCKAGLKCMAAMLAQGLATVKEFLTHFDFSLKALKSISKKRDRKQKPDTRTCFIRFCLAFFVFGDITVVKQILEEKGLAALILNDVHFDSAEITTIVLETLLNNVVNESKLLKKTKLTFFNPIILSKFTTLCKNSDENVSSLAHEILVKLSTNTKLGICFVPDDGQMADKFLNPVLLKFLVSNKQQASQQTFMFNLTIKTLQTCPDIVVPYLNGLNIQLEPRSSDVWYANIAFMVKLLKHIPPPSSNIKNKEALMKLALPKVMTRAQFMAGLKSKVRKVQLHTLLYLEILLSRCLKITETNTALQGEMFDFEIVHALPDVTAIIAIRQVLVSKTPDTQTDQQHSENQEGIKEDQAENSSLLVSCVNCLLLFQKLKPGILTLSGFNVCKLLQFGTADIPEQVVIKSFEILLLEQAGTRAWIEKKITGVGNVLTLIFDIVVHWKEKDEVLNKANKLFFKILDLSGHCSSMEFEMDLWFSTLTKVMWNSENETSRKMLCKQFSDCCLVFLNEPFMYVQEIMKRLQRGDEGVTSPAEDIALPFSPLLVALVKSIKSKDFISKVTIPVLKQVLTCQANPTILLDILKENEGENDYYGDLVHFIQMWISVTSETTMEPVQVENILLDTLSSETVTVQIATRLLAGTFSKQDKSIKINLKEILNLMQQFHSNTHYVQCASYANAMLLFLRDITYVLKRIDVKDHGSQKLFKKIQTALFDSLKVFVTDLNSEIKECIHMEKKFVEWSFMNKLLNRDDWLKFAEDFHLLCLQNFQSYQKSQFFQTFMTYHLSKLIELDVGGKSDEYNERLLFLNKIGTYINPTKLEFVISLLVEKGFEGGVGYETFDKIVEILFKKQNVPTTMGKYRSQMIQFLQEIINCEEVHKMKIVPRIDSLTNCLSEVKISNTEFRQLLTNKEGFVDVAVLLCRSNVILLQYFIEETLSKQIPSSSLTNHLLPVTILALKHLEGTEELQKKYCEYLITSCWDELLSVLGTGNVNNVAQLMKLLLPYMSNDHFKAALEKTTSSTIEEKQLSNLFELSLKLLTAMQDETLIVTYSVNLLMAAMFQQVKKSYNCFKFTVNAIKILRKNTQALKKKHFEIVCELWEKYFKKTLKLHFENTLAIEALQECISVLYKKKRFVRIVSLHLKDIYQMIISHSKFLEIMFNEEDKNDAIRCSIVMLLTCIIKLDPGVCNASIIPILMVSYKASLSKQDQFVRTILQTINKAGTDLSLYYPFVWGKDSYDEYMKRRMKNVNLFQEQSSSQILECLDQKRILKTIIKFPISMNYDEECIEFQQADIYDPFFLLPLFSSILQTGCQVDCRHFVDSRYLSLTLSSLSSKHVDVRRLGYYIITLFSDQLESSRFKEHNQVTYFLLLLKNSISEEYQRFPSIWCVFFARYLRIIFRPDQYMYPLISNTILQKPVINCKDLPVFLPLFNSSSLAYSTERAWILKLLNDGMKDQSDFYLYKKYHVFELLMAFYNSHLADKKIKPTIINLFSTTCSMNHAAFDLVKTSSFISWIHTGIARTSDHSEKSSFIHLLLILVKTFGSNDGNIDNDDVSTPVPRLFINEALLITRHLILDSSIISQDRIHVCYSFVKLLRMETYFGDILTWIHDEDLKKCFHQFVQILESNDEPVEDLDEIFASYVDFLLHNRRKDALNEISWKSVYSNALTKKMERTIEVFTDFDIKLL